VLRGSGARRLGGRLGAGEWRESWDYSTVAMMESFKMEPDPVEAAKAEVWKREVEAIFNALPDDTILTVIDAHN
jgi:hypothetical protein